VQGDLRFWEGLAEDPMGPGEIEFKDDDGGLIFLLLLENFIYSFNHLIKSFANSSLTFEKE
jgi:hypothetical protein